MPHIAKPPLFLHIIRLQKRPRMRKQALFEAAQKHQRKLQPLGCMQRHQRDLRPLIVRVGIADQRRMIEKLVQRLAAVLRIHRRIDQFAQVLNARIRLRRVFLLKLLDVARAVNQEFQNLRRIGRRARSAKAFDGRGVS